MTPDPTSIPTPDLSAVLDQARGALREFAAVAITGSYASTQITRTFPGPIPVGGSHHYHADARTLDLMRRRAREAERNHILAGAVIRSDQELTVGGGFTFRCHTDNDAWNTAAEAALYHWLGFETLTGELAERVQSQRARARDGRRTVIDVPGAEILPRMDPSGLRTGDELMAEIVRAWNVEGDIALLLTDRLSVQIIEAERIVSPQGRLAITTSTAGGGRIFDGVEVDGEDRVVAVHVGTWDARGRLERDTRRIPIEQVVYVPNPLTMAGSARRGLPTLATCLERFLHIEEVDRCARLAAWIQTAITAFIVSNSPTAALPRMGAAVEREDSGGRSVDRTTVDIGPGMINHLAPGEGVEFLEPKSPGTAFDTYLRTQLMQIGAATRVPMFAIAHDGKDLNLSTCRAIYEMAARTFDRKQAILSSRVGVRLARFALAGMIRQGILPPQSGWHEIEVTPPPRAVMDGLVEAQIVEKLMSLGIISRATATMRYQGLNSRAEGAQIKREIEDDRQAGQVHPAAQPVMQQAFQQPNPQPSPEPQRTG